MKEIPLLVIASLAVTARVTPHPFNIPTECPLIDPIDETVHLPHEYDCTKFYKCSNGQKIIQDCSFYKNDHRLYFDPELQVCNWPWATKCQSQQKECTTDQSVQPHPYNCSLYYKCENGRRSLETCNEGQRFDSELMTCMPAQKAHCKLYLDTCPSGEFYDTIFLPHDCKCSKYYQCVNGEAVERYCPSGQEFDVNRRECVLANEVVCNSNTNQSPVLTSCPASGIKNIPHAEDCNLYYECVNGVQSEKKCKHGLSFDERKGMCTWPPSSACSRKGFIPFSTIQHSVSDEIQISATDCSPEGSNEITLSPHHCSCSKYYACVNGEKILKTCPDGMDYDYVRQTCDHPERALCKHRVIKSALATPTRFASQRECSPNGNERLPHESNCTLYYECRKGERHLQSCYEGHYFNDIIEACDLPENTNCVHGPINTSTENPGTPSSTSTENPGTPSSTSTGNPGTPSSTSTENPGTPPCTSTGNPSTPSSTSTENPGTPSSTSTENPGTPSSTSTGNPGTPSSTSTENPGTPSSTSTENPGTPSSTSTENPGTPSSTSTENPGTPSSTSTENPGTPSSTSTENPGTPSSTSTENPGTPSSTSTENPGTPSSTSTENPGTPSSTSTENPGTPSSTSTENPGTPSSTSTENPGTSTEKPGECDATSNCRGILRLPHGKECSLYYKCENGRKVEKPCPKGLYFDPVEQICDWPENVDCVPGQLCVEGERFHHECQCNMYYECKGGQKTLQTCPRGKFFDYRRKICDARENVNCFPSNGDSNKCIGSCSSDFIKNLPHEDCKKYCRCNNGVSEIVDCPKNKYYDSMEEECDWPENVSKLGCDPFPCSSDSTGDRLPHECYCDRYYVCLNGTKIREKCEIGLYFDYEKQTCVNQTEAHCFERGFITRNRE